MIRASQSETLYLKIAPLNEANIFGIDIFDLTLIVLEIIQIQGPSGFPFLDSFGNIIHYNSRSRHPSVKHSINRLFLSTRHTFFVIDIIDLPLMVLEITQVQGPERFPFLDSICYISHYSSRSRHRRVKHTINRLFLSTRHTVL